MQQKRVDKNNHLDISDLSFVETSSLRNKIVVAIKTISDLYTISEAPNTEPPLATEIRRIIMLYIASIIEAILLFLYKKSHLIIFKTEYTDVNILPRAFQFEKDKEFVIAKQIKLGKNDRELMLDVLLKKFIENKIISNELGIKIKHAKDVRNTFHLSKLRSGISISKKKVDTSTEALYEVIEVTRNYLKKTH